MAITKLLGASFGEAHLLGIAQRFSAPEGLGCFRLAPPERSGSACRFGHGQNIVVLPTAILAMPEISLFCRLPFWRCLKYPYFGHRRFGSG